MWSAVEALEAFPAIGNPDDLVRLIGTETHRMAMTACPTLSEKRANCSRTESAWFWTIFVIAGFEKMFTGIVEVVGSMFNCVVDQVYGR